MRSPRSGSRSILLWLKKPLVGAFAWGTQPIGALLGGLVGEQISRLEMNEDFREVVREEELAYDMGRIRDVRQGPDGYIYVAVEDRGGAPTAVVRLEPVE